MFFHTKKRGDNVESNNVNFTIFFSLFSASWNEKELYGLKYVCVWCIICAVYLKRCALSLIYYSTAYTLTVIPQHKRAFHSKFNIYFACCELNSTLATAAQRKIVYRIFLLKILLCVHKQDNTLLPRYAKLIILNFKWKLRLKKKRI